MLSQKTYQVGSRSVSFKILHRFAVVAGRESYSGIASNVLCHSALNMPSCITMNLYDHCPAPGCHVRDIVPERLPLGSHFTAVAASRHVKQDKNVPALREFIESLCFIGPRTNLYKPHLPILTRENSDLR